MPFCRARLLAKRFIAGVGGNVPWPLPIAKCLTAMGGLLATSMSALSAQ